MIKKTTLTLLTLVTLSGVALAQNAQVILTVDMGVLYNEYWKAQEAQAKFQSSVENAQQEIQTMMEEGQSLAQQLQDFQDKMNNPAITEDSKQQILAEAQETANLIRQKEAEVNNYRQQTDRTLQQRRQSIINLHISEIRDVVSEVAKQKNADLVLNTQGLAVVFNNDALDITQAVLTELNSNKPNQ